MIEIQMQYKAYEIALSSNYEYNCIKLNTMPQTVGLQMLHDMS